MEFKRPSNRHNGRQRLIVPGRGSAASRPVQAPAPSSQPKNHVDMPRDLAAERSRLGFNDIPVDDESMDDVRFRDIFRAWSKQAVKDRPSEKTVKNAGTKTRRLKKISNDLKWALQADLEEPVKPQPKTPKPAPAQTSQTVRQHPGNRHSTPAVAPQAVHKTVDININFGSLPKISPPDFSKLKLLLLRLLSRLRKLTLKQRLATGTMVVVLLAALVITHLQQGALSNGTNSSSTGSGGSPDYSTALPDGKNISQLGGWTRVSPPDRNPVYAFVDKINGTQINVSEQPVPDNFKENLNSHVETLSKAYAATDKFTAGETIVFVGTSTQGPQSVIFAKNNLLILIKSTDKIDDKDWKSYIQALN